MTQSKYFHFPTWEEVNGSDFFISGDREILFLKHAKNLIPNIFESNLNKENISGLIGVELNKSTPSDPIFQKYPLLLELQKKLGFDVYGEYVVFADYLKFGGGYQYKPFTEKSYGSLSKNFYLSDILKELSKHYRGEESKFEEVRKVLEI